MNFNPLTSLPLFHLHDSKHISIDSQSHPHLQPSLVEIHDFMNSHPHLASSSSSSTFHHHPLQTSASASLPSTSTNSLHVPFDPGFQVPSTEGLNLLPMPVAYEGWWLHPIFLLTSDLFHPSLSPSITLSSIISSKLDQTFKQMRIYISYQITCDWIFDPFGWSWLLDVALLLHSSSTPFINLLLILASSLLDLSVSLVSHLRFSLLLP